MKIIITEPLLITNSCPFICFYYLLAAFYVLQFILSWYLYTCTFFTIYYVSLILLYKSYVFSRFQLFAYIISCYFMLHGCDCHLCIKGNLTYLKIKLCKRTNRNICRLLWNSSDGNCHSSVYISHSHCLFHEVHNRDSSEDMLHTTATRYR